MSAIKVPQHVANLRLDEMIGGVSFADLGASRANPAHPFNELIESTCSQGCGAVFQCKRFWAPLTSCDECRAKALEKQRIDDARAYWEELCPANYRKTELTHPDFPKAQYESTRGYAGKESLLLYGPSRKGKTRLAMVILKRCLVHHNMRVGVMWEEDIDQAKTSFDRKALMQKWGRYDLLLMDDALLTSARDDRTTAFLKNLIDYRMRHERHMIITSQVGAADYKASGGFKGELKKQDEARIDALLERVRETCKVIPFDDVKPKAVDEDIF